LIFRIIIPTYNEGHISGQINQMRFEKGISMACKQSGVFHGTIITYDRQDRIEEDGITIDLVPFPSFLTQD